MVTAGVYVVARSHVLFTHSETALVVVAIVAAPRAFSPPPSTGADGHQRSFGLLDGQSARLHVPGVRVGAFSAGVFHLMTHALFKALLFLTAGSVIHAMGGEQTCATWAASQKDQVHLRDHADRHTGDCGHSSACRIFQQGCIC